jgi:hypothetical protein
MTASITSSIQKIPIWELGWDYGKGGDDSHLDHFPLFFCIRHGEYSFTAALRTSCLPRTILNKYNFIVEQDFSFLAASTECSAGSNDHFVVGAAAVISLVQFDGRPLGGANFQHCATLQRNNHATLHATEQSRNLATQQSRNL